MTAIRSIFKFLSLGLVLAAITFSVDAKPLKADKDFVRKQIIGAWQLKQTATKSRIEKVKTVKNEFLPAASPIPNSLVLAADDEFAEITINEGFEKVIHTQTLSLKEAAEIRQDNGTRVKAFWQNKKLIVEAVSAGGTKITEIFELGANKNQLKVTLRLDAAKIPKSIVTKRVYSRAAQNEQSGSEEMTAEINVSQFLL